MLPWVDCDIPHQMTFKAMSDPWGSGQYLHIWGYMVTCIIPIQVREFVWEMVPALYCMNSIYNADCKQIILFYQYLVKKEWGHLPALRKWRSSLSLTLIITQGLRSGTISLAASIPSFTALTTEASAAQSMQSTVTIHPKQIIQDSLTKLQKPIPDNWFTSCSYPARV